MPTPDALRRTLDDESVSIRPSLPTRDSPRSGAPATVGVPVSDWATHGPDGGAAAGAGPGNPDLKLAATSPTAAQAAPARRTLLYRQNQPPAGTDAGRRV